MSGSQISGSGARAPELQGTENSSSAPDGRDFATRAPTIIRLPMQFATLAYSRAF
jgi:hypothetical protein